MNPADNDHFGRLSKALRSAGIAWPVLIVDAERLDRNLDRLAALAAPGKSLRLVTKSLPVPDLLDRAARRLSTNRMMTFSVAMLEQVDAMNGDYRQMLGKPVPSAALAHLLEKGKKDLASRTIWLADTLDRICQYEVIAARHGVVLPMALEIDVGLRRGGLDQPDAVLAGLEILKESAHLRFAGLMGYEPHLPAMPAIFGIRSRTEREFESRFGSAIGMARSVFGPEWPGETILNTAGSKTIAKRMGEGVANDFSVGSLLVKPLDFDDVREPDMQPALFIATPVLKRVEPFAIPGFGSGWLARTLLGGGARRGVYVHGGHWLAEPVYPKGLSYSGTIGRSSNQELMVTRGGLSLEPDDFVFLRPHQSEAVMLQFGPVAVFENGAIAGWWDTFPASA